MQLYVVKRSKEKEDDEGGSTRRSIASKESMYISNAAWQPSVEQTRRGMAALLSSLYIFSHTVGEKGAGMEEGAVSVMYTISRFPPAVRACQCFHLFSLIVELTLLCQWVYW